MLFKPYSDDKWFYCKQPRIGDVDLSERYFGIKGEFSPASDIAFRKHLRRLDKLASLAFVRKMNGQRIKFIRRNEPVWY